MTWFTATSVTVNNGQTVVSVNTGDDIQLAQESGGLIIGNNPPVEIKRSYLDGSNNKKIELRSAWPYANQTAQPAVAFPTDGDLAAATAVLKQLIDGFALATQAQAEQGTNNTAAMTALRVKQAIDFFRPLTTSATDSTAGRMLKVGDFGVGAIISAGIADADSITASGLYGVGANWVGSPFPGIDGNNQGYILHHNWSGANYSLQTFFNVNQNWYKFTRRKDNGSWTNWVPDYNAKNILGAVSQSAGVPTGAIIQRGTNANGDFVRFADGTQICKFVRSAALGMAPTGVSNLFVGSFIWQFPAHFADQPAVSGGGADSLGLGWISCQNSGASEATVNYFAISANNSGTFNMVLAIGRWF